MCTQIHQANQIAYIKFYNSHILGTYLNNLHGNLVGREGVVFHCILRNIISNVSQRVVYNNSRNNWIWFLHYLFNYFTHKIHLYKCTYVIYFAKRLSWFVLFLISLKFLISYKTSLKKNELNNLLKHKKFQFKGVLLLSKILFFNLYFIYFFSNTFWTALVQGKKFCLFYSICSIKKQNLNNNLLIYFCFVFQNTP